MTRVLSRLTRGRREDEYMPLNTLPDDVIRGADRVHVWFNVILGYSAAVTIPFERTWWNSPLFSVPRSFPHSQAVWAWTLAIATTVYTIGSFRAFGKPHRGAIIIAGSLLCFVWYLALTVCLIRETYVNPAHASSLWTLLLFFVALLYGHRSILYLNTFIGARWSTDPFQMYAVTFLLLVSVAQVVIGVSPQSVQAEFDKSTQLSLAGANLVGGIVVMAGLHLRRIETGLWIELWGYVSLTMTLFFYIFTESRTVQVPIATLGFNLSEAFVLASLHRAMQIGMYKWAVYRGNTEVATRLQTALTHPLLLPHPLPPVEVPHSGRHRQEGDDGNP